MTLKEVAQLFRVSPQTVSKLVRNGNLIAAKIGNQWRFDPRQVRRCLSNFQHWGESSVGGK